MNILRSDGISRLLHAKQQLLTDDGSGDVVYAMFMQPGKSSPESKQTLAERMITFAVNTFQPSPVMCHVELVVPCCQGSQEAVNFAIYIGQRSNWQTDKDSNEAYYLGKNTGRWRAVPVFGKQAAQEVREVCSKSIGVRYSMLRYLTASWPLRVLSGVVADATQSPAHCATLTARILRKAIGACTRHPSAWYGPSTLYSELCRDLRDQRISPETTLMTERTTAVVEIILRSSDDEVQALHDAECFDAIRALTLKAAAAEAYGDTTSQKLAQTQLATALFRWSVLRKPARPPLTIERHLFTGLAWNQGHVHEHQSHGT
tara:strand:+ start:7375 stop:8325 length:951 start_codon:yes stop_codon:yes gene_type:complete